MTRSVKLRKQGNDLYKQLSRGGFCSTITKSKLRQAYDLYTQALHASDTPNERASASKNLGMLHLLWCKTNLNGHLASSQAAPPQPHDGSLPRLTSKQLSPCRHHLLESIINLLQAKDHGANTQPQQWLDNVDLAITGIVEWATEQQSALFSYTSRSPLLQYVCQALENASPLTGPASATLLAYKNHADALFKEALTLKLSDESMDNYNTCQGLLQDSSFSLRKAAAAIPAMSEQEESLRVEVERLEESVNVHICICKAMQEIALGDKALSQGVVEEEEIDMEKVKDALDHYRQASQATRELDMETEAIAMSKIGKVYSDVYKMEETAHKYHYQATKLALTVMSPSILRAEWYKYSSRKVSQHQEKVAAEERQQQEKDRRPVLERIKEKVDTLTKEARKSSESLLKFLYAQHPHPDLRRNVVPILEDKKKVKSALKRALLHYHPDNNMQFGEEWKVLCEEICMFLNKKYENFK